MKTEEIHVPFQEKPLIVKEVKFEDLSREDLIAVANKLNEIQAEQKEKIKMLEQYAAILEEISK